MNHRLSGSRIALLGESAGVYLALMAAARLGSSQIQGVVAIGGPTQLWALAPEIVPQVEDVFSIKGERRCGLSPRFVGSPRRCRPSS